MAKRSRASAWWLPALLLSAHSLHAVAAAPLFFGNITVSEGDALRNITVADGLTILDGQVTKANRTTILATADLECGQDGIELATSLVYYDQDNWQFTVKGVSKYADSSRRRLLGRTRDLATTTPPPTKSPTRGTSSIAMMTALDLLCCCCRRSSSSSNNSSSSSSSSSSDVVAVGRYNAEIFKQLLVDL